MRRLSAIMFSDMVGYTALMQEDEVRARRARDRQRAVLERHIHRHGGRILQLYGDGALSVFDSAIEAVSAATAIQQELAHEPRVPLRVGIHTGDVVYDEDGVFGDGVNVASRVESLGTAGSVLVSAKVYDEIRNQPHLAAVSLGEFQLKNVRRPIEVFAMVADGLALPPAEALPSRAREERRSVAVLPFVNMSADAENEYFSDGITEELINVLTRVNGLQVTARTSSFAFKARNDDVRDIATKLGVELVLEGSVRRAGSRARITAQLIDAGSGYHIFSETWDRRVEDVFETQDEIARAIVDAVRDRLAPERRPAPILTARTDAEAHGQYLHGLHELARVTPEGARRALEFFERSIGLDPGYANAYAALARAHTQLAAYGQAELHPSWASARAAARRAVELDPSLGDAHTGLGLVRLLHDWDFDGAYAELQKGLGLSPGSAAAHEAFATYLRITGDMEGAVEEAEAAVQLDPLSLPVMMSLAATYLDAGRFADALAQSDRVLEADPGFRAAVELRGLALAMLGEVEEAVRTLDRVVALTGDPSKWLSERGYLRAVLGQHDEARRCLDLLRERAARHPEISHELDFFILHTGLGQPDAAADWLQRAVERRLAGVLFTVNGAGWPEACRTERYWRIIEECGLGVLRRGGKGAAS